MSMAGVSAPDGSGSPATGTRVSMAGAPAAGNGSPSAGSPPASPNDRGRFAIAMSALWTSAWPANSSTRSTGTQART